MARTQNTKVCSPSKPSLSLYRAVGFFGGFTAAPLHAVSSSAAQLGTNSGTNCDLRRHGNCGGTFEAHRRPFADRELPGAGSPYKSDRLMNPYSQYGSPYSNKSWTNPYATNAPRIVGEDGDYHGRLSTNPYDPDSTSNPYGRYGSQYSPDSLNNPYGAGNPNSTKKYYVIPGE